MSHGLKLCGCIGNCYGFKDSTINKKIISDIKIGESDTNIFRMGQCDKTQSYAFYLETKNEQNSNVPPAFVQLQFV